MTPTEQQSGQLDLSKLTDAQVRAIAEKILAQAQQRVQEGTSARREFMNTPDFSPSALSPAVAQETAKILNQLEEAGQELTPEAKAFADTAAQGLLEQTPLNLPAGIDSLKAQATEKRFNVPACLRRVMLSVSLFLMIGCTFAPDQVKAATPSPSRTPTELPTKAPTVAKPTATPTPGTTRMAVAPQNAATATREVQLPTATEVAPVMQEFVTIPAGVNIRKSPNGEIIKTNEFATKFRRTTDKPVTVAGKEWYSFYMDLNGDDKDTEVVHVAGVTGVLITTEAVKPDAMGGSIEAPELSVEELLLDAQTAFPNLQIAEVFMSGNVPIARTAEGLVVAAMPAGEWELNGELIPQEEVAGQVMSFAEFSALRPDLVTPEKIGDGKLLYSSIKDGKGSLERIDITALAVRITHDGVFEILNPDGTVAFRNLDTHNFDETLNDWAQPMIESTQGLLKIYQSVHYNDIDVPRMLPDQQTIFSFGLIPADIDTINKDAENNPETFLKNIDPAVVQFLTSMGYFDEGQEATTQLQNPLDMLDKQAKTFFELLQGSKGEISPELEIIMPDGTKKVIKTSLGVNIVLHNTPGDKYWLTDGAKELKTVSEIAAEQYEVTKSGQLVINMTTNYGISSSVFGMSINRTFSYILGKNGQPGDIEDDSDINSIRPHSALNKCVYQLYKNNGVLYLVPNILVGINQSPNGNVVFEN